MFRWITGPRALVLLPMLVLLIAAVACGDDPTPTRLPTVPLATPTPTNTPTPTPEPSRGTLVVAMSSDIISLDPAEAGSALGRSVMKQLFDPLLGEDPNSDIAPRLATEWSLASDNVTYTFELRKGIKFHDGTDFNAEAARFSLVRGTDNENEYFKLGSFGATRFFLQDTGTVEAVDDDTFRVTTTKPAASYLRYMAGVHGAPVSPTAVMEHREEFKNNPSGAGPFTLVSWDPGEKVAMARNRDYWEQGLPRVDELVFQIIPEAESRAAALQTGTVHVARDLDPDRLPGFRADPDFKVLEFVVRHVSSIDMNFSHAALSDTRVRQAISYAIDKETIRNDLWGGIGIAGTNFTLPSSPFYNANVMTYPYNPDKAKSLLEDAGYGSGLSINMVSPSSAQGYLAPQRVTTFIQSNVADVGITLDIQLVDFPTWRDRRGKGDFDTLYSNFFVRMAEPDNDTRLFWHTKPSGVANFAGYESAEVDRLTDEGLQEFDSAKRVEIYKKVQEHLAEDVASLIIGHIKDVVVTDINTNGYTHLPNGEHDFRATAHIE